MDLENFPTCETAKRMLGTVTSGYYDKSYVGKWLFQVMGLEMEDSRSKTEELISQAFPETATWGLRYHEEKYGIAVREDLVYEERRNLIFKARDSKFPMTPYRMELILSKLTGREIYIDDSKAVNQFEVQISPGSTNYSIGSVIESLMAIKQSHVLFSTTENTVTMAYCGCTLQEAEVLNLEQRQV